MKHHKKSNSKLTRQKKTLKVLLILLAITTLAAGITIYRDYQSRPGRLKKIWISERGADHITVAWEKPRNTYRYAITCNGKTIYVSGIRSEMRISGLDEDTSYEVSVRADSKKREGFEALSKKTRTKKTQTITGIGSQIKFANTLVDLKQSAETNLSFTSNNQSMKVMGDKLMFTRPGKYVVNVTAEGNDSYVAASKRVSVNVLDTISVDTKGAGPHIFYRLNKNNCKLVKKIKGVKEAATPQSFVCIDGVYYVAYVSRGDKYQRIISFGDKKTVYNPKASIGHANGMTLANGRIFVAKGGSNSMVSFKPPNDDFYGFDLPNKASGIAYDEKSRMFYTSQYSVLGTYDENFGEINHFPRISRKSTHYTQDSGAYAGIMMSCISPQGFQGTNYIDFYDMMQQKYMGSIQCDLNELESILVNEDGYIELLCNTRSTEDYIWRTPINMKMLCEN